MQINSQLNATHNALNDDHSLYYTQAIAETYAITGTFESSEVNRELTNLKAVRIA